MTPTEAARVLDLSPESTPEQIEIRFLDLRRKLEDKIAKAPTPGLQAKYRESLGTITTAFETLTLAADSSTLPVLNRQPEHANGGAAANPAPPAGPASVATAAPPPRPTVKARSGGGREFVLVALIAVAVLAGGGWFVMQQRADKAAAEAAALQQKREEEARAAAQARKIAELRTELATAKVAWDALENRLREAERRTSEAKSESRSFRDGPAAKKAELSAMARRHEMFSTWLNTLLATHPAKIARARAEQLLSDKLVTEAEDAVVEMREQMEYLQQRIPERANAMLDGTATVEIHSKPTSLKFVFTDAYGRQVEGVTPAKLSGQPLSDLHDPKYDGDTGDTEVPVGEFRTEPSVRFFRPGWPDIVKTGRTTLAGARFAAEFPEGKLQITAQPASTPFVATNSLGWRATGTTPATLTVVPPGKVTVTLTRAGFREVSGTTDVGAGKNASISLDQRGQSVQFSVAEPKSKIFVNGKFAGYEKATVNDLTPGEHNLQIEAAGYRPYRTKFTVKQEASVQTQSYSFKQLAVENISCDSCKGAGSFPRGERCNTCNGRSYVSCYWCDGKGGRNTINIMTREVTGWINCEQCRGSRRQPCNQSRCDRGTYRWNEPCTKCGGDGLVSRLQLSP